MECVAVTGLLSLCQVDASHGKTVGLHPVILSKTPHVQNFVTCWCKNVLLWAGCRAFSVLGDRE